MTDSVHRIQKCYEIKSDEEWSLKSKASSSQLLSVVAAVLVEHSVKRDALRTVERRDRTRFADNRIRRLRRRVQQSDAAFNLK